MKFKKIITVMLSMSLFFTSALFAGSRKDIDKFLKSYEEFVIEDENAAKKNNLTALMNLSMKSVEFTQQADKLDTSGDWTSKDLKKYTDLTMRYSKAMSKMAVRNALKYCEYILCMSYKKNDIIFCMKKHLILIDEHPLMRVGIKNWFERNSSWTVDYEAGCMEETEYKIEEIKADMFQKTQTERHFFLQ